MPTEKRAARTTKPGPAAPKESPRSKSGGQAGPQDSGLLRRDLRTATTAVEPQAGGDHNTRIELSDITMDAQNWRIIKPLLADRIRRGRLALRRLAGEEESLYATESLMVAEGDDAAALWQLAEQLDSRLDRAFAPRARRAPLPEKPKHPGGLSGHDDYKAH